jgi:hypothetical protein
MDATGPLTINDMLARRHAMEQKASELIGAFAFRYSRFVTGLHLCVAWHDEGEHLQAHAEIASDLGAADLLRRIDKQVRSKLSAKSSGFRRYRIWLRRSHELRIFRNLIFHSRLGIEAYGRHAIATSTILVEPVVERDVTLGELESRCRQCETLTTDLYKLREEHPL